LPPGRARPRAWAWLNFPVEARRFSDTGDLHAIAEALEVSLPGGYRLLVGQNTTPQRRMQVAIIEALVWSLLAMVCLGLAAACFSAAT
jgi:hypothetical protein